MDAPVSMAEFIAFAESVSTTLPGSESFARLVKKYPDVIEPFLPKVTVKMRERAEKFRNMGLTVPDRFFAAAERSVEDYSHDELVALFRPAWAAFKAAGGVAG